MSTSKIKTLLEISHEAYQELESYEYTVDQLKSLCHALIEEIIPLDDGDEILTRHAEKIKELGVGDE